LSDVEVTFLRTGTAALPAKYLFRDAPVRGGSIRVPLGALLLEHPTHGPLLIDTGMAPLGRVAGAIARGVRVGAGETVPARLRARGIEPASIELIAMTHLHPDHVGAVPAFPAATFVVDRAEWASASGRLAPLRGYVGGPLPPRERVRLIDGDTHDLLGDGSVRLVATPGHTAGHRSVLLRTTAGEVFYLADAVYTLRNLHDDVLPWRTHDDGASRASMERIRTYARDHPDTDLIPCHDPEVWDRVAPMVTLERSGR
jgi:glyoxylase-like metal-dependent hydrolase (beta-lactamase superfamily II)